MKRAAFTFARGALWGVLLSAPALIIVWSR